MKIFLKYLLSRALLIVGVILFVMGFFYDSMDPMFPSVRDWLKRKPLNAKAGLDNMREKNLTPEDQGFEELEEIFKDIHLDLGNPKEIIDQIDVLKILPRPGRVTYGRVGWEEHQSIEFILSNDQKVQISKVEIMERIEEWNRWRALYPALVLFFLGLILEVSGLAIDFIKYRKDSLNEESQC